MQQGHARRVPLLPPDFFDLARSGAESCGFQLEDMSTPPLTEAQLSAFESSGFALLESPLTPAELDAAEDAFDRLIQVRQTHPRMLSQALAVDPPFVELVAHPWFEAVAKQLLRAEHVRLIELGPSQFRPGTGKSRSTEADAENWRSGAHLDIQVPAPFNLQRNRE